MTIVKSKHLTILFKTKSEKKYVYILCKYLNHYYKFEIFFFTIIDYFYL